MKKIYAIAVLILCVAFSNLFAETHSGTNLILFGDSVQSMGRGGTGVSSLGSDLFYLNPAAIGLTERFSIDAQYGTLQGTLYNPDITIAVPTPYGVVGGGMKFLYLPESYDLNYATSFSIGGAKDFTSKFFIGGALNFIWGRSASDLFYIGATIGTIYRFDSTSLKYFFGIFEPSVGFSINFGIPMGTGWNQINFNTLTAGYSFKFVKVKNFALGFFNDFSAVHGYADFGIKFGLEAEIINSVYVRAGMIVPFFPAAYDYGKATFGLGYKFKGDTYAVSANYAFAYYRDNIFIHYLSASFEYGEIDIEAPVTEITPDKKYFSPNHDGIYDYILFKTSVEDKSRVKGWKVQMQDDAGKVVREFRTPDRDVIKGTTFTGFFKRLVARKTAESVPDELLWDGTDNSGATLPDGKYSYSFTVWDEKDNISAVKGGSVIIDNALPEVKLKTDYTLFSPNGDKKKDELVIYQSVRSSPDDEWSAEFAGSDGKPVRNFAWKGNVPARIVWDGKDDYGDEAPEGIYTYTISSKDLAGNSGKAQIKNITLTRQYETADLTYANDYFSFRADTEIKFFPRLSNIKGLEAWKILITDSSKKLVREIKGETELPPIVKWDCTDEKGNRLSDGEYFVRFESEFDSGNTPSTFDKKIIFDSTPPELKVSHQPRLFSPDGDGENDILTIETEAREKYGIKEWQIKIIAASGDVFKTFKGTGNVPREIKWDGMGANRELAESAADYIIVLEAADLAGNTAKSSEDKLEVDVLVLVTERGLKMRISNIEFLINSAKIAGRGESILNRVREILNKYRNYDVLIEGHTDDTGAEDYNLKLSEERALSVMNFLIDKGIDKNRLSFRGMGETVPLYPNTSVENQRRNRRVEFLLIKKAINENILQNK